MEPEDHLSIINGLNRSLEIYQDRFSAQFHLKIPKGVIRRIDSYRDTYFPYLKDSQYKSNICYLLQNIDFQLWLYRVFRPGLSVENAFFYQQTISMGIIAEALAAAMLLDPLIAGDSGDRSKGAVEEKHHDLQREICAVSLHQNIEYLKKLEILPEELIQAWQEIRTRIRNTVHIQNWEGRLYQSLNYEQFREYLDGFRQFLAEIAEKVSIRHSSDDLHRLFFGFAENTESSYQGRIISYNAAKGFGFIRLGGSDKELFFHASEIKGEQSGLTDRRVEFRIRRGRKGVEAWDVKAL